MLIMGRYSIRIKYIKGDCPRIESRGMQAVGTSLFQACPRASLYLQFWGVVEFPVVLFWYYFRDHSAVWLIECASQGREITRESGPRMREPNNVGNQGKVQNDCSSTSCPEDRILVASMCSLSAHCGIVGFYQTSFIDYRL